jgi:hypothetical protein
MVGRAALSRGALRLAGRRSICVALLVAAVVPATPAAPAAAAPTGLALQWAGGMYPLPNGEHVSVYVSARYPDTAALAQKWASFFGGLPHGNEVSLLTAYIAPPDEVEQLCDSPDAFGCYGGDELVTAGDTPAWIVPATSVAAHEYGHHIAAHRNNAPWRAPDWGAKRWATQMNVCRRVAGGTAFPGDEAADYAFNPGEAFAESYRVLAETGTAAADAWPIVDPSFRPDASALAALREDVLDPWTGPAVTAVRGRFKGSARVWTATLGTPLDGDLSVRAGASEDVSLLSADGHTVLARSTWTSAGGKVVAYRVCGTRSLRVRVSRLRLAASFTLRISKP